MSEIIFEKSLELKASEASSIPTVVATWWKGVSEESATPATPGKLYAIGKYLIELSKNSLGDGKGDGKILVNFDEERIRIVIDDLGTEEKDINLNVGGEYGMKEAIEYFDVFTVESRGKMYEKNRRNLVEETDESDVYAGSKLTIIKYYITPIEEEEEAWQSNRNFGQHM